MTADLETKLLESLKAYAMDAGARPGVSAITLGLLHKFNNATTGLGFLIESCGATLGHGHPAQAELAEIGDLLRKAQRYLDLIVEVHIAEAGETAYFTLDSLVERQKEVVRALVAKKTIVHFEKIPADILVLLPETNFRQILLHLVQNADEASRAEKEPVIGISSEVKRLAPGSHVACVTVRDNGPGISPAVLPHLFEPFQTSKERRYHAGVGTYLARKIASVHGWDLTARNHPAGGAEFTLSLPVCDAQ